MVSLKSKLALSLCFLVSSVFAFSGLNDPIVTKPIDPIPMDTPCTGGSEASASECASAGVVCRFGQTCYRAFRGGWSGGVESFGYCYHCEGESGTITPVEPGIDIGDIVIKECISGSVQYRPNGNCGTQENKCCGNGKWSGFGVSCPSGADLCTSSQCWNGSICEDMPSSTCTCTNGTCSKLYACESGTGWSGGLSHCRCNPGYTSTNISGPCYKEEVVTGWNCRVAGSGECRNPVNNRHDSPCQSLNNNCSVGSTKSYYSCQTCYTCTCTSSTIRPVFPS